jgi:hypothetical protein
MTQWQLTSLQPCVVHNDAVQTPRLQLLPDDLEWSHFTDLQQLTISIQHQTDSAGCGTGINTTGSGLGGASSPSSSSDLQSTAAGLLDGICQLAALTDLDISGWSELEGLPADMHKLTKLQKLNPVEPTESVVVAASSGYHKTSRCARH